MIFLVMVDQRRPVAGPSGRPPVKPRAKIDSRSGRFSTEVKRSGASHEGEK
jgi:hypothetical protein